MRKRELLVKYNKIIKILLTISKILPSPLYKAILVKTRNWDSLFAIFIRYICLMNLCKKCGENVAVFSGVYILCPENLELGNNISIHPMSYIDATGGISIGDNVSIAHGVTIMSTEHNYDKQEVNIKDQEIKKLFTIIKENVWIGSGSKILAGATINKGSIVGAGAVVTKDVSEFTIVGGVPAKPIKKRCI